VTQLLLNIVAMASSLIIPLCLDSSVRHADVSENCQLEYRERRSTDNFVGQSCVSIDSPSLLAKEKEDQSVFDRPSLVHWLTYEDTALLDSRDLRYVMRWDNSKNGFIFDKPLSSELFPRDPMLRTIDNGLADLSDTKAVAQSDKPLNTRDGQLRYKVQLEDFGNQLAFDNRPMAENYTFKLGVGER
jgi:hypothetical protein